MFNNGLKMDILRGVIRNLEEATMVFSRRVFERRGFRRLWY